MYHRGVGWVVGWVGVNKNISVLLMLAGPVFFFKLLLTVKSCCRQDFVRTTKVGLF